MNIEVFKADMDRDKDHVVGFWQSNFPGWPEGKYTLFYQNDPYGPTGCWLARDKDTDTIVGAVAVFPKLMHVDGRQVLCGLGGDLGVDKKYRQHGIANSIMRKIPKTHRELGFAYVYGTPNVLSEKSAMSVGYDIVGRTVRTVKILKTVEYVKRFVRIKPLASLLSLPLDFFLRLKSPERRHQGLDRYKTEILKRFDERFDRLWERGAPAYTVVGDHSTRFLNWRYADCTYRDFKGFALVDKETNEVDAFIIYHYIGQNAYIDDLFSQDKDETLLALVAKFVLYQREQQMDVVTFYFFGDKKVIRAFERFGFVRRPDNRSIVVHAVDDSPLKPILMEEGNWHYLDGDNDADN